jgi:hypothetical protein
MNDGGGQGGGWKLDLPTLLAIVGAAAAIGLWINVVGGAVLWARFDAAGLPASQVVGIVPNTTLLAIGIKALALPLLVGIVAVAVFYISRPAETAEVKTRRPQPSPSAAKRDRPPVRKQFGPLFGAIGRASVSGFKSLWRRPSTMHAKPPPTDDDLPGIRGFGRVLVALLVLSVVTVLVLFGGDLDKPQHQEYLYAWAIAAPFLVLAAATYEPVNRGLLKKDWRDAALIAIGVAGFLLVCLVGWLAGHVWPAVWVGLLSFAASLLSLRLPPGHKFANLLSAGMLLIFFYLGLGAALYFFACDGSATLKPGDQRCRS